MCDHYKYKYRYSRYLLYALRNKHTGEITDKIRVDVRIVSILVLFLQTQTVRLDEASTHQHGHPIKPDRT